MVTLAHLWLPTRPRLPLNPHSYPSPIDSICDITETEKISQKPAAFK